MLIQEQIQVDLRKEFETLKNSSGNMNEELLTLVQAVAKKANEAKFHELECDILIYLGRAYRLTNRAFQSINALNKAYIILNSHFRHQKERLANIYRELGNTYSNSLKDHLTSIEYQTKGFNLNVKRLNGVFLNNIGSNHMSLGEFDKAFHFFQKGIKYSEKINEVLNLAYLYSNCGEVKIEINKPAEAINYLEQTIQLCEKFNPTALDPVDLLSSYWINSLAYYLLAKAYLNLDQLTKAKEFIKIGKVFSKEKNQYEVQGQLDLLEGKLLRQEKKMVEFEKLYNSSIKFCEETNLLRVKHEWLTDMQNIHEKNKDYQQAFFISKQIKQNAEDIKAKHQEFNVSQILVSKEEEILALENKNRIMQLQKDELKQFAYIVTHDLKTPLSNISNFAGLFKKRYLENIDDKGKGYIDFVINSASNLSSMLSALMQYISFDSEENESFEACEINKVITKTINNNQLLKTQYSAEYNGITTVPIRSFHLEIILENLIKNSKKFKQDSEPLFIDINIQKNSNEYIFEIGDNGIGIDDKYKSQIFEIFKRLNKNESQGTGIGLSICKKIIERYMGNLWVEDNVPAGSIFKFTIPIQTVG